MPTFRATSILPAPAGEVFEWHTRPGAFERLQPPWDPAEVLERTGEGITPGTSVVVKVSAGGIAQRMQVEHTRLEAPTLFEDVQRQGPFRRWIHQHRFHAAGEEETRLEDHLDYELPLGPLGRTVAGGSVRSRLERLFAYRHRVLAADLRRHREAALTPRTFLISGASGMLGSALVPFLTAGGHRVRRLVRRRAQRADEFEWAPGSRPLHPSALEGVDVVINLSGANLGEQRWTPARKSMLKSSRTEPTATLASALAAAPQGPHGPRVFVSLSASGYYGHRHGDRVLEDDAPNGSDFIAQLCRVWEEAARPAAEAGVRVVHPRLGPVISVAGGMLERLLLPFRLGLGGRLGDGRQWLPVLSREDVLGALLFAVATPELTGAFNLSAPNPVTNRDFTRTLSRVLGRPSPTLLPAPALRAAFGELGEVALLGGQRMIPSRLASLGFRWQHRTLEEMLRFELGRDVPPEGFTAQHDG